MKKIFLLVFFEIVTLLHFYVFVTISKKTLHVWGRIKWYGWNCKYYTSKAALKHVFRLMSYIKRKRERYYDEIFTYYV
jgi:hypothetical protein